LEILSFVGILAIVYARLIIFYYIIKKLNAILLHLKQNHFKFCLWLKFY